MLGRLLFYLVIHDACLIIKNNYKKYKHKKLRKVPMVKYDIKQEYVFL